MNIICDTNTLASDYSLQGARFSSLFDYLKRSDGRFVILDVVEAELLGSYARELKSRIQRASTACRNLYAITQEKGKLPEIDITKQLKNLQIRLAKPPVGVKVESYSAHISHMDIVNRGVQRQPPANEKGEELRDVIIWLSALDFAKQNGEKTAFITNDSGFWADQSNLASQIVADLALTDDRLSVYRDLEQFISQNNMKSSQLDADWIANHVDLQKLEGLALERVRTELATRFWQSTFDVSLGSLNFSEGVAYEVSSNASFVELQYDFLAYTLGATKKAQVENYQPIPYLSTSMWKTSKDPDVVFGSVGGPTLIFDFKSQPFYPSTNLFSSDLTNVNFAIVVAPPTKLNCHAKFNLRIVDGTPTKIELDSLIME